MLNANLNILKKGIWIYFFLLIIEGGLRRWFLPSLATPLLLIREPVAIYLLFFAKKEGIFPDNKWVSILFFIGIVSVFTAIIFGHGNLTVALFGARILLIQFPVVFVIGRVFNRGDVEKIGKIILLISIPMAILITMQFYSPQSAWVNKGIGNSLEGAGFSGSGDYFRPPGTFSFITGVSYFFGLAACFVFYFWLQPKSIAKWLLIAATAALLIAIPTSISRTLFFEVVISLIFFLIAKSTKPDFSKNLIQLLMGLFILLFTFSKLSILNTQISAFTDRFTSANETEGGLNGVFVDRFLGGMVSAFTSVDDKHAIFGQGIGMGTNAGAQLLSGKTDFLLAEGEWGRTMQESGLILGLLIILVRIDMTIAVLKKCYQRFKTGDYLGWMLLSFGFVILLQGGWAQPNNLGFYILTSGLLFASFNSVNHPVLIT